MTFLIFSYDDWNDDAPRGWDALVLISTADTIEEARKDAERAALEVKIIDGKGKLNWNKLPKWEVQKYHFGQDYQIVDAQSLELVERGRVEAEWTADGPGKGNTYSFCKLVPKTK